MSTTSSPARPVRSPTPVLNKEDVELQAFLAAAQREAQEKWEKLRAAKTSGVVGKVVEGEAGVVGSKENVVEGVAEEEEEVVPKIILIPKKRRNVVETEVAESSRKRRKVVQWIPTPIPFPSPFLVPANVAFVATRFVGLRPMLPTRSLARGATLRGKVARSSRS
ncbi:hypothetical protein GGU11DRAFT_812685 [Lentinula aff. detonsa]|nr:hypothetical protein GGU11DRAFT_812685 [Lentinula aff. detonsa]